MRDLIRRLIDFLRPIPKCPRCKLLDVEAIDIDCKCTFADRARQTALHQRGTSGG